MVSESEEEHLESKRSKLQHAAVTVGKHRDVVLSKEEREKRQRAAAEEIPYTFAMPEDVTGLNALLSGHSLENQKLILERLVACHAVAVASSNRDALERLYGMLMQRLLLIPDQDGAEPDNQDVDAVSWGLFQLTQAMPGYAASQFKSQLLDLQQTLAHGLSDPSGPQWPTGGELLLLKATQTLFPCSDLSHPVSTPYMLLLSQLLSCAPVLSLADLGKALFVASILVSACVEGKRVAPELISSVAAILCESLPAHAQETIPRLSPAGALLSQWHLFDSREGGGGGRRDGLLSSTDMHANAKDEGMMKMRMLLRGQVEGSMKASMLVSALKVATSVVRGCRLAGENISVSTLLLDFLHTLFLLTLLQEQPSTLSTV